MAITSNRTESRFIQRNVNWLESIFDYSTEEIITHPSLDEQNDSQHEHSVFESFTECSERQKMRKTSYLRKSYSGEELLFAAKMKMREEGRNHIAKILDFFIKHPDKAETVKNTCFNNNIKNEEMYSKEKALTLMVALNFSVSQYRMLRDFSLKEGSNLFSFT